MIDEEGFCSCAKTSFSFRKGASSQAIIQQTATKPMAGTRNGSREIGMRKISR
jgi:hypothetical protein